MAQPYQFKQVSLLRGVKNCILAHSPIECDRGAGTNNIEKIAESSLEATVSGCIVRLKVMT